MGIKLDEDDKGNIYKQSILNLGELCVQRATRVWLYADILFNLSGIGRKYNQILKYMSWFRDDVIEKRRNSDDYEKLLKEIDNNSNDIDINSKGKKLAMLDLLLKVEKNRLIDINGIKEEVDTFMFEVYFCIVCVISL